MQQAYRVLRVVAESQTIRIVLMLAPNELMLGELCNACSTLNAEGSNGVKAIVLDFKTPAESASPDVPAEAVEQACLAIQQVAAPVLAVVRGTVSPIASTLIQAADLTLVGHTAALYVREMGVTEHDILTGAEAFRLGLVTWTVSANAIDGEMERILDMLRAKSAVALRLTRASTRVAATTGTNEETGEARLEALKRINEFYLTEVMKTADAAEGLLAFLEKRKPHWKND